MLGIFFLLRVLTFCTEAKEIVQINNFAVQIFAFCRKDSHWAKFGFNPSLIDGILNVLPYELASYMGYEKPKKWQLEHADWKIFCDLDMSIP